MRTAIKQYIIDQVREFRTEKGISQLKLVYALGFKSVSYIGEIESSKKGNQGCYNVNHLNKIAILFGCSPKDFLPGEPFPDDLTSGTSS